MIKYSISNFDKGYYERNFYYAERVRFCRNNYECLGYDEHGTLSIDTTDFVINKKRWIMKEYLKKNKDDSQYIYLDSISSYCKQNNIKLLFFDSPIREGLKKSLKEDKKIIQQSHIQRVRKIIEKNNHVFIDSSEKEWADSLFVDAIHFNEHGAKYFTEYCFSKITK